MSKESQQEQDQFSHIEEQDRNLIEAVERRLVELIRIFMGELIQLPYYVSPITASDPVHREAIFILNMFMAASPIVARDRSGEKVVSQGKYPPPGFIAIIRTMNNLPSMEQWELFMKKHRENIYGNPGKELVAQLTNISTTYENILNYVKELNHVD